MMNTQEIDTIMRPVTDNFLGVFPSDHLPTIHLRPACFIANTDASNETGTHWVAMYFDNYVEYFDSYGLEPLPAFQVYDIEKRNKFCLQDLDTDVCGQYCIYYLFKRTNGQQLEDIVGYLRHRSDKNDSIVKRFVDNQRRTTKKPSQLLSSSSQLCLCHHLALERCRLSMQ